MGRFRTHVFWLVWYIWRVDCCDDTDTATINHIYCPIFHFHLIRINKCGSNVLYALFGIAYFCNVSEAATIWSVLLLIHVGYFFLSSVDTHALSTFLMNFQHKAIMYSRRRTEWRKTQHALTAGAYSGNNRMGVLVINIIRTPFLFYMTHRDYNKTLPTNKWRLNNTHASLQINNSCSGGKEIKTHTHTPFYDVWQDRASAMCLKVWQWCQQRINNSPSLFHSQPCK